MGRADLGMNTFFHEFQSPMHDVERMGGFSAFPVLRVRLPESMEFPGIRARRLKVTKAKPVRHKRALKVNMKVKMPKKQQERIAKYQKKAVAARVQWIKALRKKMLKAHKQQQRGRMAPKAKCVEKQCVANGGKMHCKVVAFKCGQPNGGKHFSALRKMLKGMHKKGGKAHHVKVIHIVPSHRAQALAKVLRKVIIHAMKAKLKAQIRKAGHNPNGRHARKFFRKLHRRMQKKFKAQAKAQKKAAAAQASARVKIIKKILKARAAAMKKAINKANKAKKGKKGKAKMPAVKKKAQEAMISDRVKNHQVYHIHGERIVGDGPGLHHHDLPSGGVSHERRGSFMSALFGN